MATAQPMDKMEDVVWLLAEQQQWTHAFLWQLLWSQQAAQLEAQQ